MLNHSIETYKLFFRSLANPNRLKIINSLRKSEKCVSEIIKSTGFEQTMVSHNLKILEKCGMVFAKRNGKHKYYSLNKKTIKPLLIMIDNHMSEYCVHIIKGER